MQFLCNKPLKNNIVVFNYRRKIIVVKRLEKYVSCLNTSESSRCLNYRKYILVVVVLLNDLLICCQINVQKSCIIIFQVLSLLLALKYLVLIFFNLYFNFNKPSCHDITEILLKVVLNTINHNQSLKILRYYSNVALPHGVSPTYIFLGGGRCFQKFSSSISNSYKNMKQHMILESSWKCENGVLECSGIQVFLSFFYQNI